MQLGSSGFRNDMKYKSNLDDVMDNLVLKLESLKETSPVLREIALSIMTSSDRRIFNESKDVSGANITYKRPRKTPKKGAYSKAYARLRESKGRQTSKVDLFMTGVFHKTYQAQPIPGGWGIGFASKYGGDIYKYLDNDGKGSFGRVWGITAKDKRAIQETMNREINKRLR